MDEKYNSRLRKIHRVNRLLWLAILSGISVLTLVVLIFDYFKLINPQIAQSNKLLLNMAMVVVLFLLFLIIYIKQQYLTPQRMTIRAQNHNLNIGSQDVTDLLQEFGAEAQLLAKSLMIMRRYYMVIWSIANLIVMLGFIQYILAVDLQTFLIYGAVGFFSLISNFPRFSIIETVYFKTL